MMNIKFARPYDFIAAIRTPPFGKLVSARVVKSLRKRLYNYQDGLCYYCGNKTSLEINQEENIFLAATIEHVYDRWDIRRGVTNETVLACYFCNQLKSRLDHARRWQGFDYSEYAVSILNILKTGKIC
ncbi:MAG TPA: hypothetical protein VD794_03835 [Flavisolibacter sp.]|nr:hypothetical protein [Flavisolibacter sp.]